MRLLVAERFNVPKFRREYAPERWYELSLRLGAFRRGDGRRKLELVGATWDASLNLTPPDVQGVPFDAAFARQVAQLVEEDQRWTKLLLVGRRVSDAFGIPRAPWGCWWLGRYLALPHPSELSHFWNDPVEIATCREMMHESA